MLRIALLLALVWPACAGAAQVVFSAERMEGPTWRAEGVRAVYESPQTLQLDIARVEIASARPLRNVSVRCPQLRADLGAGCPQASFALTAPDGRRLAGSLQAQFTNPQAWQARLTLPAFKLDAALRQDGQTLRATARLGAQPAAGLAKLARTLGAPEIGELDGRLALKLEAQLQEAGIRADAETELDALSFSEPSGRYATDKLSARAALRWSDADRRWQASFASRGGQAYVEPVFLDFGAQALRAEARGRADGAGWRIGQLRATQGESAALDVSGTLDRDLRPRDLDLDLDAADLGPPATSFVQPFLIGTKLEGASLSGRARAKLSWRQGAPAAIGAELDRVALKADKLGVALQGLSGHFDWGATRAEPSELRWSGGALQRVPLGPSSLRFRAQGRDFELLAPWRQPLLGGALRVERLGLRDLGAAQMAADFRGAVEPIDLAALCRALGWPEFGGTLGGRLPGLSVRDKVWAIDGALEAQLFDGTLRIDSLRAIEPFGVLPRLTADLRIRGLDLEQLTGAFSFGRITGRLDGDVAGLRLLRWSPVAFDARLYSTPGGDERRRISQRAIDNISAIGGGPTGVVSRGVLSLFDDFAYARLGISCVLRDGVCRMDGVEPAKTAGGQKAYYLVKGRLLPRIDVVGYAERVSWTRLVEQLKAAQAAGGLQTKPPG